MYFKLKRLFYYDLRFLGLWTVYDRRAEVYGKRLPADQRAWQLQNSQLFKHSDWIQRDAVERLGQSKSRLFFQGKWRWQRHDVSNSGWTCSIYRHTIHQNTAGYTSLLLVICSSVLTLNGTLFCELFYTGWAKKQHTLFIAITLSSFNPFSSFLAHIHCRKFATGWCIVRPPNAAYVTTLPCKKT